MTIHSPHQSILYLVLLTVVIIACSSINVVSGRRRMSLSVSSTMSLSSGLHIVPNGAGEANGISQGAGGMTPAPAQSLANNAALANQHQRALNPGIPESSVQSRIREHMQMQVNYPPPPPTVTNAPADPNAKPSTGLYMLDTQGANPLPPIEPKTYAAGNIGTKGLNDIIPQRQ
jgi:hypothetical protein